MKPPSLTFWTQVLVSLEVLLVFAAGFPFVFYDNAARQLYQVHSSFVNGLWSKPYLKCAMHGSKYLYISWLYGVQDGLELSTEQQRSMLDARQRLLKALTTIRQDREKIILELGLALLQKQAVSPADN